MASPQYIDFFIDPETGEMEIKIEGFGVLRPQDDWKRACLWDQGASTSGRAKWA